MSPEQADHTKTRPVRVPESLWSAYGRICKRLGTDRTNDLLDRMRERVHEHGDAQDQQDLQRAEEELVRRRSRKGGRPPKQA